MVGRKRSVSVQMSEPAGSPEHPLNPFEFIKPFLDEQKFTFPVLLAKDYVEELLPVVSIPRNWIVDARGKWRAEQIGFGHDENWESSMLQRLEQTKPE